MAIWTDELVLIRLMQPEKRVNENGFPNPAVEERNTVFCNKKSVGYSEYYKSQQIGIQVACKVEIHIVDYQGEEIAELEGKRYSILKSYKIDDEKIELTLSDLRQKAGSEA